MADNETTRRSVSWKERAARQDEAQTGRTDESAKIRKLEERINNLRGGQGIRVQDGVISLTEKSGAVTTDDGAATTDTAFVLRIVVAGALADLSIPGATIV